MCVVRGNDALVIVGGRKEESTAAPRSVSEAGEQEGRVGVGSGKKNIKPLWSVLRLPLLQGRLHARPRMFILEKKQIMLLPVVGG